MLRRPGATAALLVPALLGAGCARPRDPNVVLITLDTVRADHLSCYGYPVRTSPRIDALARVATLYRRALASSPWTLPTHASLFTGRHPYEHGAHGFKVTEDVPDNAYPLGAEQLTLAEALQAEGYETVAVVANAGYMAQRYRLDQGFEAYWVKPGRAARKNGQVYEWLEARRKDRPFFLFVNYMDAHRPYNAAERPGFLPRPVSQNPNLIARLAEAVMPGDADAPEALRQQVVDQYDTALANLDEELGRLFDRLEAEGLWDDALVVVTSDHGEFLGEHRLAEHSKDLYQEVLAVPLIVKAPRQREGRVSEQAITSVDVPRLVVSQLARERHARLLAAFPYEPGNHPVLAELYYTRTKDLIHPRWGHRFDRVRTALLRWPTKLIHSSDGRHELYDLAGDPGEARDLHAERQALAASLLGELEAFRRAHPGYPGRREAAPLAPEDLEELRALGYVGAPP
ncbi:MAG TPA: sulfatase [Vicinamibacteria bacterium]|nr:sulfatase [Vicinamibacteria bacterium]